MFVNGNLKKNFSKSRNIFTKINNTEDDQKVMGVLKNQQPFNPNWSKKVQENYQSKLFLLTKLLKAPKENWSVSFGCF